MASEGGGGSPYVIHEGGIRSGALTWLHAKYTFLYLKPENRLVHHVVCSK
jgi:hypothetical protein